MTTVNLLAILGRGIWGRPTGPRFRTLRRGSISFFSRRSEFEKPGHPRPSPRGRYSVMSMSTPRRSVSRSAAGLGSPWRGAPLDDASDRDGPSIGRLPQGGSGQRARLGRRVASGVGTLTGCGGDPAARTVAQLCVTSWFLKDGGLIAQLSFILSPERSSNIEVLPCPEPMLGHLAKPVSAVAGGRRSSAALRRAGTRSARDDQHIRSR